MQKLKQALKENELAFALWSGFATFLAYFCMYMFRKPYTAGTYSDMFIWGVDYKIIIVIAQVLGYATSKFLGIKIIAELKNEYRIKIFLTLIIIAWGALVGFAYSPPSWGVFWLFLNGLPLGLIWGIVFSYCEGRKLTEVLTVLLAANFIITSGIAKSVGRWIIAMGFDERSMPMILGIGVFPLLAVSLWMLIQIPPPSDEEKISKKERLPMTKEDKKVFLRSHWFALLSFVVIYLILTIVRDIRDNFAVEIWSELGFGESPSIFTSTEFLVTIIVLISLGLLYRIQDNFKALNTQILICLGGIILLITTTLLFLQGVLSPVIWMVLSGIGLFLPYILMNGIIFDRFIAAFGIVGNVGFIMYISDATGYLGSIFIMLYKNFGNTNLAWLPFYTNICIIFGIVGAVVSGVLYLKLQKK